MEVWRAVIEFPSHYEVSNFGRVRRVKLGSGTFARNSQKFKILRPKTNKRGYKMVALSIGGKVYSRDVHTLVAKSFLGEKSEDKPFVLHKDGKPGNNRLNNLRYGNWHDNYQDALSHGTYPIGSKHSSSKLTESQVKSIREDSRMYYEIGEDYRVSETTVSSIKSRKCCRHV